MPADTLEELADDQFQVREVAQLKLLNWAREHGAEAPELLFREHRNCRDPEVKIRCMEVLKALAEDDYAMHGQGFIGIQMQDEMALMPETGKQQAAIRITSILVGLAAEKAGLVRGDLLVGINGKAWRSPATVEMRQQVMDMKPTTKITLQVLREEKIEDVDVVLVKRPKTADNPMLHRMPLRAAEEERKEWEKFFQQWKSEREAGA
ncbi:MAG: PDZ domain-containing protein [Luteolibacter sp.]